jgi:polyisoprenoid-binding protein YceI
MKTNVLALWMVAALTVAGCAPATSATPAGDTAQTPTSDAPAVADAEHAAAAPVTGLAGKVIELSPNNAKIDFVGTKPSGDKHDGGFKQFAGKMEMADQGPSKIAIDIETDSLWSDAEKLTNHLKGSDFFEVQAYPKATFVSTKIVSKATGGSTHEVTGDLTLHGATKSITFPIKVTGGDEIILSSDFTISRKEFGITYGEGMIDDAVQISVAIKTAVK